MTGKIVPFIRAVPTKEDLEKEIHRLAVAGNIAWHVPHFKQRLRKHDLSMTQVLKCLKAGKLEKKPERDQVTGVLRGRMRMTVAGSRVRVVVEVEKERLTIVTVFS